MDIKLNIFFLPPQVPLLITYIEIVWCNYEYL